MSLKKEALPLEVATKLHDFKKLHRLSYSELGKKVGLSASLLSSRIVHCKDNPLNKEEFVVSKGVLIKISEFLTQQENYTFPAAKLKYFETAELIAELRKRGAVSIIF